MNINTPDTSNDTLLGFTMFLLIWPPFNIFIACDGLLSALDHELKLGPSIWEIFFSMLFFIGGIGCLVGLLFSLRRKHSPLNFKKISAWVVGVFIAVSAVNLAYTLYGSCKISTGECARITY